MNELDPSDVILWLLPYQDGEVSQATRAISDDANKSRFVPAPHKSPRPHELPQEEREQTEPLQNDGSPGNTGSLVFLFSRGARTSFGLVGGCGTNVDLFLPRERGLSNYHFAITFDEWGRLILRDLDSTNGTKVTYNGEKGQRLIGFNWPLVGPSITNGKSPVLHVTPSLQFEVVVPSHDHKSSEYIEKVKKFRMGVVAPENLFPSLIIQSAQATQLPSGQETPLRDRRSDAKLFEMGIGKGNFAVVTFVWNMVTREEYVEKRPRLNLMKSYDNHTKRAWRREAAIMANVSHDHIVAFLGSSDAPYPSLRFEYICGGSLDRYTNFSTFENTQVLTQLSSALEYLHSRNPPIGHRDIKPENILVTYRRRVDGIYVKFADFGLSKASDVLRTRCGTLMWAAPEIYSKVADPVGAAEDTYSVAVDIWSLGVVVAWSESGLPVYEEEWQTNATAWPHAVQSHVNDMYDKQGSELLYFIIDNMLVEDPDERSSADYIHTEAANLLQAMANDSETEGSATPTQSILSAQTTMRPDCLDENSENGNVDDSEEAVRTWLQVPGTETRQGQVPEPTQIVPQRSAVDSSLWNTGD